MATERLEGKSTPKAIEIGRKELLRLGTFRAENRVRILKLTKLQKATKDSDANKNMRKNIIRETGNLLRMCAFAASLLEQGKQLKITFNENNGEPMYYFIDPSIDPSDPTNKRRFYKKQVDKLFDALWPEGMDNNNYRESAIKSLDENKEITLKPQV